MTKDIVRRKVEKDELARLRLMEKQVADLGEFIHGQFPTEPAGNQNPPDCAQRIIRNIKYEWQSTLNKLAHAKFDGSGDASSRNVKLLFTQKVGEVSVTAEATGPSVPMELFASIVSEMFRKNGEV